MASTACSSLPSSARIQADVDYMHRMCQLYEAAQFVAEISGEDPVVLCGDFNMIDSEYAYRIITEVLQMKDCFADTKEMTSDTLTNKWRTGQYPPARLDYVFLSNNGCRSLQLEVVSKGLSLNGLVPGLSYNFSDHEGLEVELRLTQPRTYSATELRLMEHFSGGCGWWDEWAGGFIVLVCLWEPLVCVCTCVSLSLSPTQASLSLCVMCVCLSLPFSLFVHMCISFCLLLLCF